MNKPILINTITRYKKALEAVKNHSGPIGFDTETSGAQIMVGGKMHINPWGSFLVGYSFALDDDAYYVPVRHKSKKDCLDLAIADTLLLTVLEHPVVWAHNWKYDLSVLRCHFRDDQPIKDVKCFDSLLACKLADMKTEDGLGLKALMTHHLDVEEAESFDKVVGTKGGFHMITPRQGLLYAAQDAWATLKLGEMAQLQLVEWDLWDLYRDVHMPCEMALADMQHTGINVDLPKLKELRSTMAEKITSDILSRWGIVCGRIRKEFSLDEEVKMSIRSPKTKELMFELGVLDPKISSKSPRTGQPSWDKETMSNHLAAAEEGSITYDMCAVRKEYQDADKVYGTYVVGLAESASQYPDLRVHGSFSQTLTDTGRFSCLVAGSLVTTRRGQIPVEQVAVGDEVWTHNNRWKPVTAAFSTGVKPTFDVVLSNGQVVSCTGNHRFLTTGGLWAVVEDLYECVEEVDWESIERGQNTESLPGLPDSHSETNRKAIGHNVPQREPCPSRALTSGRTQSSGSTAILSFESGPVESYEGVDGNQAPCLQRRLSGRAWVSDSNVPGQAPVCPQTGNGSSFRFETPTLGATSAPHRRLQDQQLVGQLSAGDRHRAQDYPQLAGPGQLGVSIEAVYPSASVQVFDLTVEDDHSFLAQGVFSHNCSAPNLQNIPSRSQGDEAWGKQAKACFIPRTGYVFLSADYSQLELRILAHFAGGVGNMAQAYIDGIDLHQQTADLVGCSRTDAKTLNFATVYGASSFRIQKTMGKSQKEAERLLEGMAEAYPEIDRVRQQCIRYHHKHGFIRTISGVRRTLPNLRLEKQYRMAMDAAGGKPWKMSAGSRSMCKLYASAERKVFNTPVQGSGADVMKAAMANLRAWGLESGTINSDWYMVAQVHDELCLEVRNDPKLIERMTEKMKTIMEQAWPTLKVPLVAEPSVGENWLECK